MRINVGVAAGILLVVIGAVVAVYSYTQLQGQDVRFDQNSIQMNGHSYLGYEMTVDLNGKFAPRIVGGVGSVGSNVDFYVVNDTSWNLWSTNQGLHSALSTVHVNATAVSSQSNVGQFSFIPSTTSYSVVFVNDEYPSANNASVHAMISLQYISLFSLYGLVAGLVMLGIGIALLTAMARRKVQT